MTEFSDIDVLNEAVHRIARNGWIKNNYANESNACCLVGAIDEYYYMDYLEEGNPQSFEASEKAKLAVAKVIIDEYMGFLEEALPCDMYETFMKAYESNGLTPTWAEVLLINFNDSDNVGLGDIMYVLEKAKELK